MKKLFLATMIIAIVGLPTLVGKGQPPADLRVFMGVKLQHSQKVLEGLVEEDYDTIAKHSQELALLSQASNWQVLQTEDYLRHSIEFRRAANALTDAAKEENIDGATLAYIDVTMNCVRCHKYVRGVRTAAVPERTDGRRATPIEGD